MEMWDWLNDSLEQKVLTMNDLKDSIEDENLAYEIWENYIEFLGKKHISQYCQEQIEDIYNFKRRLGLNYDE